MTERFIRDQEKTAIAFLRAYVEGLHYFKTHPEESSQVAAAMLRTTDLDALRQSWKVYERITSAKPYPSSKGLEPVIRLVAVRKISGAQRQNRRSSSTVDLSNRSIKAASSTASIVRLWVGSVSAQTGLQEIESSSPAVFRSLRVVSRAWNRCEIHASLPDRF